MDDILRSIKNHLVEQKLLHINSLHPNLKFTIEVETEGKLLFLDICIIHHENSLASTWYCKPTDTGLIMNFHALAPKRYKRSVVEGFVHRIYRACSDWTYFHQSLAKAKEILERNQYPPEFYDNIIKSTIEKIIAKERNTDLPSTDKENNDQPKINFVIEYRGISTEKFLKQLRSSNVPVQPVVTLRKVKTALPSLKPEVKRELKSRVVYKINCPGCNACYVGQTTRHVITRFNEHNNRNGPIKIHFEQCMKKKPHLKTWRY